LTITSPSASPISLRPARSTKRCSVERPATPTRISSSGRTSVSPEADDARSITTGLHLAIATAAREEVDRLGQRTLDAGYLPDGDPGPRPEYGESYYGGFLRDPDGNSAEVVHRGNVRLDGDIDHLWIRVTDCDESKRFVLDPDGHNVEVVLDDRS
jgi:hypothetical protein